MIHDDDDEDDFLDIRWHRGKRKPKPPKHRRLPVHWALGPVTVIPDGYSPRPQHITPFPLEGHPDMSLTLKDTQTVHLAVTGKDGAGLPAAFTGTPVFSIDNTSAATLDDHGDGSADVTATGTALGTATVTVVDQESGGQEFTGSLAIDVIGGDLVAIEISAGTPTEKPAPSAGGPTLYQFVGEGAVDLLAWHVADVVDENGGVLYVSAVDGQTPTDPNYSVYTGPTSPAPSA